MSLISKCQICNQPFFSFGDLTSDPSQHFCLSLDGPGIVQLGVVAAYVDVTPEDSDDGSTVDEQHAVHKSVLPTIAVAVLKGQHISKEVTLTGGERVIVEIAVRAK